ncbi:hypothetical protein H6P81_007768 [Aristolochia fimbriata]|uniref:Uncharacterized protein n=1 Tax=Aristolochia fimbriata TaxID=158543 RepID=A0AAV7F2C1_ARIFI|nr:hypothetical protein H6P81_007768 [Aristolochia fimbriata]
MRPPHPPQRFSRIRADEMQRHQLRREYQRPRSSHTWQLIAAQASESRSPQPGLGLAGGTPDPRRSSLSGLSIYNSILISIYLDRNRLGGSFGGSAKPLIHNQTFHFQKRQRHIIRDPSELPILVVMRIAASARASGCESPNPLLQQILITKVVPLPPRAGGL